MRKKTALIILSTVFVIGIVLAILNPTREPRIGASIPEYAWGSGHVWNLEVADDMDERALGLGERDSLPSGHAMLFLFEQPGLHSFWMKGMRFPLDMVFLKEGKVVMVERNITPESARVVTPPEEVNQVIELNVGEAKSIQEGDRFLYFRGL